MNDISDTKRLADAINMLALTMTQIMTERLRALAQDGEGTVWVGYADGSACRITGGRVNSLSQNVAQIQNAAV